MATPPPPAGRAAYIAPPGLLFFACLAIAYVFDLLLPPGWIEGGWPLRGIVAGVLFFSSFLIGVVSFCVFKRRGTSVEPFEPTTTIVQSGPYRFSRNPLYVAQLLGFTGFAVLVGSVWIAAFLPVVFLLLHFGAILPEERYLEQRFGEEYRGYKARVRRWL